MLSFRGSTTDNAIRNTQDAESSKVRGLGISGPTSKQAALDHGVPPSCHKDRSASIAERAGTPPVHTATQKGRIPTPTYASLQTKLHAMKTTDAQHPAGGTVSRSPTPDITALSITPSPGSSRLRRRPSVIGQTGARKSQRQDAVYTVNDSIDDPSEGTVLGITLPPVQKTSTGHTNLDQARKHRIARKPLAADSQKAVEATQLRPLSDTPSTRYTTSPFSQQSAPTSISSYSPNTGNEHQLSSSSTGRKGPSLPSSPKAFLKHSQKMGSPEQAVVPDVTNVHRASIVPPELAHLDVEYKPTSESLQSPRRPSRDNTPDLSDLQKPFPIIHSDLPAYYATYRKRTPSYEAKVSASPPAPTPPRGFFGFRSRSRSRESASRADSVVASSPTPRDSLRSPVSASSRVSTPIASEVNNPATSMFGKLLKSGDPSQSQLSKPAKKLRRGPAAGTGHERYGKFGLRGRTSSISDAAVSNRSDSVDRVKSKVSRFFRSRSASRDGEGESDTDNSRKSSTTQPELVNVGKSSHDSSAPAPKDSSITLGLSQGRSVRRRESLADLDGFYRAGLLSADTVSPTGKGQVRTLHKSQTIGNLAVGKLEDTTVGLDHTNTPTKLSSSQPATLNQSPKSSNEPAEPPFTDVSEGKEGNCLTPRSPRTAPQQMRNFRQRAREIESSTQRTDTHDVGSIQEGMQRLSSRQPSLDRKSPIQADSAELPQVMSAQAARARTTAHFIDITRSVRSLTPPDTTKSWTSATSQTPSKAMLDRLQDRQAIPMVAQADPMRDDCRDNSSAHTVMARPNEKSEFLAFPKRNDSELFYTSSSDAASTRTDSTLIAQPPRRFWLGNEDIWNEYNDLLDEAMIDKPRPVTNVTKSTLPTESHPVTSSQYDKTQGTEELPHKPSLIKIPAVLQELSTPHDVEPASSAEGWNRFSHFLQPGVDPTTPYSISDIMAGYSDRTMSGRSSKVRLSPPRINHESLKSGYPSQYSGHSGIDHKTGFRPEERGRPSSSLQTTVDSSDLFNKHGKQHQSLLESADGNLRLGALMTSKWLSFGRVLFSPAHDEMRNSQDCRVLIIDGLGKDWSYFCAENYENATFYNLEITTAGGSTSSTSQNLPKYRNVRHSSLAAPFPFPGGFFNAVIFRFPHVASDRLYHSAIFECKRVLRAGGYLEISVLDMDMMNMGPRVRRALRRLKTDTNASDPETSLSNLGDTMMKLVGRRGFENIQRCVVGLPAAGRIPRSTDYSTSSDERSSLNAAIEAHERSGTAERANTETHDHIDFGKLLHDDAPTNPIMGSREKDEGITKMVSRVGRWWYSSCYESLITKPTPYATRTSIWDQPGILRECEKQGTSFRLLLCYAQKPLCPKRRTMSV